MKKFTDYALLRARKNIETVHRDYNWRRFCRDNNLESFQISPMYDSNKEQIGWWLTYAPQKGYSIDPSSLTGVDYFFINSLEEIKSKIQFVKSWIVPGDETKIWMGFYL